MKQQSANGGNGSGVKSTREMTLGRRKRCAALAKEQPQKGEPAESPYNTCLGQALQIIIVNMFDDQAVVRILITRISGSQRSQANPF